MQDEELPLKTQIMRLDFPRSGELFGVFARPFASTNRRTFYEDYERNGDQT